MGNLNIKTIIANIEARKLPERAILLALLLLIIGYLWLVFVYDKLEAGQNALQNRYAALSAQLVEEADRMISIQRNYVADPDAFARNRQQELQQATIEIDNQLRELTGQLILPRQMSQVLTTILQRETTLKLVSLENTPSSVLVSAGSEAIVPLVGQSEFELDQEVDDQVRVYSHGLNMTFEGDFIETIRYLRSLENLDTSFFWNTLNYQVTTWPRARITLNIFTLSTQRDWIGV